MPFRVTCERRDFGYATYRCFAGADFFADNESALDELVMALSRELSLYYLAYAHRVMEFIAWRRIDGSARGALLARRRKGWKSTVRRVVGMVRRSHKLTRLTTMLIQFEMVRMENRQLIERERQRIYANNTNIFLKQEVDDAIAERQDFPVEQMYRLIEFFEGRHSRTVELLVALCAAIVGGVVGAIGTAYFSGS